MHDYYGVEHATYSAKRDAMDGIERIDARRRAYRHTGEVALVSGCDHGPTRSPRRFYKRESFGHGHEHTIVARATNNHKQTEAQRRATGAQ